MNRDHVRRAAPATAPIVALPSANSPRGGGANVDHIGLLDEVVTELPPIVVHRHAMRMVHATHRPLEAALRGDATIDAPIVEVAGVDEFPRAVELNRAHELPLSRVDKRGGMP